MTDCGHELRFGAFLPPDADAGQASSVLALSGVVEDLHVVKTISGPCGSAASGPSRRSGRHLAHADRWRSGRRVFGLAEPFLLRAAQRSLRTDLAILKRLLEDQNRGKPLPLGER